MTIEAHKVRIFRDSAGEWRWTAHDSNGEPVADSDEGYSDKTYTEQAILDLFPNAIIEVDEVDES
jgi:uncharacterized protein YegP (UPF0339 family)